MRILSATLTALSLLIPMGALALGIGEIRLHSALNQALDAEIPLITTGAKSVSDIRARLASPSAFEHAGIERHYFLSSLRFKPILRPNGRAAIQVTSNDAIREPYMDFLVEVSWPQGRLLRQFTVVLDPPPAFSERTAPVFNPRSDHASYVKTAALASPSVAVTPQPKSKGAGKASRRSSSRPKQRPRTYGPTVSNDSLWTIAERVNTGRSTSTEQVMLALYKANPHAFEQANVNALKVGQTLRIPSPEAMAGISQRKAKAELDRQQALWAAPSKGAGESAKVEKTAANLRDTAAPNALPAAEEEADGGASREIPAAAAPSPLLSSSEGGASEANQENEHLRSRLRELEQQLARMERLLAKNDEQAPALAEAQQSLQTSTQLERSFSASDSADAVRQENPMRSVSVAGAKKHPAKRAPVSASEKKPAKTVDPDNGVQSASMFSEPFYLTAIGSSIIVLAALGWLLLRKRRMAADEAESILTVPSAERSTDSDGWSLPTVDEKVSTESNVAAESSFLSEFAPSEFAPSEFSSLSSEHDEIEPTAEADVYLAYGRYQQAEELMRQAIESNPENAEYKMKLLEIFYAAGNKEAFEDSTTEWVENDAVTGTETWDKIVAMGRELCPENPLFDVPDATAQSSSYDVISNQETEAVEAERFGLDAPPPFAEEIADVAGNRSGAKIETLSTEFEGGLERGEEDRAIDASATAETASNQDNVLEFEPDALGLAQSGETTTDDTPPHNDPLAKDADLTLLQDEDLDEPVQPSRPEALEQTELKPANLTDADSDLDFELAMVPMSETEDVDGGESNEVSTDFADMDEVETKLDLAKAYVDMDDEQAARGILTEILDQGNGDQKIQAEALVAALNSK